MPNKTILIADSSHDFLEQLKHHSQAKNYTLLTASSGLTCLKILESQSIDLAIVELMLPEIHGIEILKIIKNQEVMKKAGVILSSYHMIAQNYHSALKAGASYFIEKPITPTAFFKLIHNYFAGTLYPEPFHLTTPHSEFIPIDHLKTTPHSYLKFWGTRGSHAVSGADYVRFGGNTPCLEIRDGEDLIIIDSGSGIRGLGVELEKQCPKTIHLILGHTHWDHLLGFPFFPPIYKEGVEIRVYAPVAFEKTTKELFSDMLAYAYFPVRLEDIRSKIIFQDLRDHQTLRFGNITIATSYAFHPGPTLCFKIHIQDKIIGYATDNEFLFGCHLSAKTILKKESLFIPYQSMIQFFKGCDLLIHEAQYTPDEYQYKVGWGHSSITNTAALVVQSEVKRWIATHHDPRHTDEHLLQKLQIHQSTLEEFKHPCVAELAYDGMIIPCYRS